MGSPRGCFSFSKLNDLGFVGGCEGDIDSTLTMLLFDYAFHIPGFISDPVPDLAKNALLHFHCTSSTKMDGPCGKRLPFRIRDQTDSRGGAALEVQHRVGQAVTCAFGIRNSNDKSHHRRCRASASIRSSRPIRSTTSPSSSCR